MNRKSFVYISALIVVIFSVVLGYHKQKQQSKDTLSTQKPQLKDSVSLDTLSSKIGISNFKTYKSKHQFKIDYPANWRIESTIEKFNNLEEAQKVGGNHFSILSYDDKKYTNEYGPVPQNEIKIDVLIFDNLNKPLDEWISSFKYINVTRSKNMTVSGKTAKKIWGKEGAPVEGSGELLAVFYVQDSKGVIFYCWPYNTKYLKEFDEIVETFKFLK